MKKFFLLIVAMCCIAVTGCTETTAIDGDDLILTPPSTTDPDDKSDEELEPKDYPFYEYDVTLYVTSGLDVSNEEYPTTYDMFPDVLSMANGVGAFERYNGVLVDFAAEFDKFYCVIHAKHVGKVDFANAVCVGELGVGGKIADCLYHVTVKSPLDTFIVPVTEFGESMDYVIEHETRELQSQSETELVFNGEGSDADWTKYYFEESGLYKIEMNVSSSDYSECRTYLKHLWEYSGSVIIEDKRYEDGFYRQNSVDKSKFVIGYTHPRIVIIPSL